MSKEEGRAVIMVAGHRTPQYSASITVQKELTPPSDVDGLPTPTFPSIVEDAYDVATKEGYIVAGPGDELPALRVQSCN